WGASKFILFLRTWNIQPHSAGSADIRNRQCSDFSAFGRNAGGQIRNNRSRFLGWSHYVGDFLASPQHFFLYETRFHIASYPYFLGVDAHLHDWASDWRSICDFLLLLSRCSASMLRWDGAVSIAAACDRQKSEPALNIVSAPI